MPLLKETLEKACRFLATDYRNLSMDTFQKQLEARRDRHDAEADEYMERAWTSISRKNILTSKAPSDIADLLRRNKIDLRRKKAEMSQQMKYFLSVYDDVYHRELTQGEQNELRERVNALVWIHEARAILIRALTGG